MKLGWMRCARAYLGSKGKGDKSLTRIVCTLLNSFLNKWRAFLEWPIVRCLVPQWWYSSRRGHASLFLPTLIALVASLTVKAVIAIIESLTGAGGKTAESPISKRKSVRVRSNCAGIVGQVAHCRFPWAVFRQTFILIKADRHGFSLLEGSSIRYYWASPGTRRRVPGTTLHTAYLE